MIDADGTKKQLSIRRLYCPKCKRIHHELPDCLVPYKRHCADTMENVVSGDITVIEVPDSDRTIQRIRAWWKVMEKEAIMMLNLLNNIFKHKTSIIKAVLLILLAVTATINAKPTVISVFNGVQAAKKKLPIYCVETPDKKVSVSFDAAWG